MITAHMIVKNEDQWIWFAIKSILPYVDKFLITDTGSTDNTIKIIKSIKSKKIKFNNQKIKSAKQVTKIRQDQIDKTKKGWIWQVDGDEIYPKRLCKEIVKIIKKNPTGILVKRHDLLGDIYYRQTENVGAYNLFGCKGHLSTRLVNKDKIEGLKFYGDYPLEGYYDKNKKSLKNYPKKDFIHTKNRYWHAGYLKRSSLGGNLTSTLNRNKYKIEKGFKIYDNPPEVFYQNRPRFVPNPLKKRGLLYEILARMITPIKKLKRMLIT